MFSEIPEGVSHALFCSGKLVHCMLLSFIEDLSAKVLEQRMLVQRISYGTQACVPAVKQFEFFN